jgi:hypothetical protein
VTWFDEFKSGWRKAGMSEPIQGASANEAWHLGPVPVSEVERELDITKTVFFMLLGMKPTARIRVLRNIQEYLAEEP